jgi:hypothetical protein
VLATANKSTCTYKYIFPELSAINIRGKNKTIWPVLPPGWQISDCALTQMRESAGSDTSIIKLISLFNKKPGYASGIKMACPMRMDPVHRQPAVLNGID